ncbi:hypothetical protein MSBRW_1238 [Methanosarcina barkeri str. Wiesmoor]|uniref:Uncharacterized protein n=2 Tax=Methanosarcina barkeri TaxID=2208 RepID=A0A0E3LL17_METBA|nr:hypothetical protein [Methanosarcina barkeri]AKB50491.1 hypothetical protein MSBRW_1238 [Methanosarcina barkeri str. Wiesmoor]
MLGYAVDRLIKAFNPYRKEVMNRYHFCKLMNLLDSRLQKQGVDIKLPGYWYKYGFYTEERLLDQVLPYPFSENCILGELIYPPTITVDFSGKVAVREQDIILKTISILHDQYGFKEGYGDLAKKESYDINSPYKFNTLFQEYLLITNKNVSHVTESLKDDITIKLDELLSEFPIDSFPEIASIHFDWDDTTRVVLDYAPDVIKLNLVRQLRDIFWEIYPKRVRIDCNQNIPEHVIRQWKSAYKGELNDAEETIENIRNKVLDTYYTPSEDNKEFVKYLMQDIYNIPNSGV